MSSLSNALLLIFTTLLLVSCTDNSRLSSPELVEEDKFRLGSTPPSCHNRCNLCNPCMAVQVPTLPRSEKATTTTFPVVVSSYGNQYSNYKPLGWKCRCRDRLYDP
ncbi:hypothetical protein Cni_G28744 [Canna indica]|uniref:Epidermal patterning factor-like protein n=1 Tax=Canna indica TaxID=4628 RepID=A0AAQ3L615_9LILI|nr:hypothetical protein Cni_G28744 [Canna indica]